MTRKRAVLTAGTVLAVLAAGVAATWRPGSGAEEAAAVATGAPVPAQSSAAPSREPHTHQTGTIASPQERLALAFAAIDAADRTLDHEALDVDATAKRLGGNPRAVAEWVNRSIRYEHYSGVLRGAWGTLVSRRGSICDQAVLVKALLEGGGTAARLRIGAATPEVAQALIARSRVDHTAGAAPAWLGGELRAEVERHYSAITAVAPAVAEAIAAAPPRSEAFPYCWVEATHDGATQDVEPVLGGPKVPRESTTLTATVPPALKHRVSMSVVLKTARATDVLLTHAVDTSEYRLEPLTLSIVPAKADLIARLQAGADVWRLLEEVDTFQPVLVTGKERIGGKTFDISGQVAGAPRGDFGAGALGGAIGNMLGGGTRTDAASRGAVPRRAMRVLLEYRVSRPGDGERVSSRTLVDLPESDGIERSRLPLRIIQRRTTLIPTFPLTPDFIHARFIASIRANRAAIEGLSRVHEAGKPVDPAETISWPLPLVALARAQDLAADVLSTPYPASLVRGEAGILDLTSHFRVLGPAVSQVTGVDIVSTGFETPPAHRTARVLRAKLGLYSSLLEARVLGAGNPSLSASRLADAARRERVPLVVALTPPDINDSRFRLSARQREAVTADLTGGHLVVAYAAPVTVAGGPAYGWWRVDRRSGEVLAVMEDGSGGAQTASELTLTQTVAIGAVSGALGSFLLCWLHEGVAPSYCVVAGVCGGLIGGVFGALTYGAIAIYGSVVTVGGVFGAPTISAGTQGTATVFGSVVLDNLINGCQGRPPIEDPNDNDLDGRPNDEDPNDDCPSCDDDNPPENDRNDHDSPDGTPGDPDDDNDGVADSIDPFPSNQFEHSDIDRDGLGDNHEDTFNEDTDGDGVRNSEDDYPHDPAEQHDSDRDGLPDSKDPGPNDPDLTVDGDRDGIDDSVDLDTSREGPWIVDDGGSDSVSWKRPGT